MKSPFYKIFHIINTTVVISSYGICAVCRQRVLFKIQLKRTTK